jgi:hypothetical protein
MDTQVNLIFEAVKKTIDSPRERQAAIIRAGRLAQVYVNYDESTIEEVFGLPADRMLKDDVDMSATVRAI